MARSDPGEGRDLPVGPGARAHQVDGMNRPGAGRFIAEKRSRERDVGLVRAGPLGRQPESVAAATLTTTG